jgi:hypothetical protein
MAAPEVKSSRRHVAFGAAVLAVRGARRVTTAALAPSRRVVSPVAGAVWRFAPLSPARRTIGREIAALEVRGRREERDLRRGLEAARERLVIGTLERPELERLIVAALDSPATDRIVQRVLKSAGVERAIARVLESELLMESTERALRSEEIGRVLEWIAHSPEIRKVVFQQSAGLADVVGQEVRGRSAHADDAAERFARTMLRRRPRSDNGSGP